MGPNVESMNAPLPAQPRRKGVASGSGDRDAGQGAGIESGLFEKSTFGAQDGDSEALLGKPMDKMGTKPWAQPPEMSVGGSVADTFGAGEKHVIKNG